MVSVQGEIKASDGKVVHIERRMERKENSSLKTMNRVSESELQSALEPAAPRFDKNQGGGCAGTSGQRVPGGSTGGKGEA